MENLFDIPNEWQFVDPSNGYLFPWYTLPMLEELNKWDMSQWSVFETGGGASTLWWAKKCKHVAVLETNLKWLERIKAFAEAHGLENIRYIYEPEVVADSLQPYYYTAHLMRETILYDVVIADGAHRDETCKEAPWHLRDGGLILADNFEQPGVWLSQMATRALNSKFPLHVFKQLPMEFPTEHPFYLDPDGKRTIANLIRGHPVWQTAYWMVWEK